MIAPVDGSGFWPACIARGWNPKSLFLGFFIGTLGMNSSENVIQQFYRVRTIGNGQTVNQVLNAHGVDIFFRYFINQVFEHQKAFFTSQRSVLLHPLDPEKRKKRKNPDVKTKKMNTPFLNKR